MRYLRPIIFGLLSLWTAPLALGEVPAARAAQEAPRKAVDSFDWALHTQADVDGSADAVWLAFRDMKSWYSEYRFRTLSGPSYTDGVGLQTGQVLKVVPKDGFPRARDAKSTADEGFILKTLEITPQRQIVVVLWGSAFDWKDYTAFYVWSLKRQGNRMHITIDSYGRASFKEPLAPAELDGYRAKIAQNFERSWSEAFRNLQALVGDETRSSSRP